MTQRSACAHDQVRIRRGLICHHGRLLLWHRRRVCIGLSIAISSREAVLTSSFPALGLAAPAGRRLDQPTMLSVSFLRFPCSQFLLIIFMTSARPCRGLIGNGLAVCSRSTVVEADWRICESEGKVGVLDDLFGGGRAWLCFAYEKEIEIRLYETLSVTETLVLHSCKGFVRLDIEPLRTLSTWTVKLVHAHRDQCPY